MTRKLGLGISILAFLVPGMASALGVGSYQLHSYLNQPLSMDVTLSGAQDLSESDILVSLASREEFDNLGINRTGILNHINFDVELQLNGNGEIHITTDKPVSKPYMDFLVKILWPTGRILREYTVLLDPASYSQSSAPEPVAPAISAPATTTAAPVVTSGSVSEPVTTDTTVSTDTTASTNNSVATTPTSQPDLISLGSNSASSTASYTVKAGDTLWGIASQYRPGNDVSVQQMIIAIENANPDAFYVNGNANFVKEGAVLQIPSESTVRQYGTREAMNDLAAQNRRWRQMLADRGIPVPGSAEQINAGSNQVQRGGNSATGTHGEVTLLTANDGEQTATGGEGQDANATEAGSAPTSASLQNGALIQAETVDRLKQQNQELSSRVSALEDQVDTSGQLLDLRNDRIVALQNALRKLKAQGAEVDPALLKSIQELQQKAAADAEKAADSTKDNAATAGAESITNSDKTQTAATTDANTATKQQAGEQQGDTAEQIAQSQPLASTQTASGDAATNSASQETNAAASTSEKASSPTETKPAASQESASQGVVGSIIQFVQHNLLMVLGVVILVIIIIAALIMRSRKEDEWVADDDEDDIDGDDDFISGGLMDDADDSMESDLAEDTHDAPSDDASADDETGDADQDPLDELDVYVAYGRFPQAIEFLRKEINKAPARTDLKVRLLEVEKEAGDDAAFTEDAARFGGDQGDIDACITRLGGDVPSAAAGAALTDSDELSLDDLESDLSFDTDSSSASDSNDALSALDDDLSIDDLPDVSGADDGDDDLDMDFDLDAIGDDEGEAPLDDEAPLVDEGKDELSFNISESSASAPVDDLSAETADTAEPAAKDELELDDSFTLDESDLLGSDADAALSDDDLSAMDTEEPGVDLDDEFNFDDVDSAAPAAAPSQEAASFNLDEEDERAPLDFDLDDDDLNLDEGDDITAEAPAATEPANTSGIDLDDDDDDFSFLGDTDENATKLDLARAYIDMGDTEGAKDILGEVVDEGNDEQKAEANKLMEQLG